MCPSETEKAIFDLSFPKMIINSIDILKIVSECIIGQYSHSNP